MKKMIIPFAILLMGAGAALATNASKRGNLTVHGYRLYFDPATSVVSCINTFQLCSTVGSVACSWSQDPVIVLRDKPQPTTPTICGNQLFRLP